MSTAYSAASVYIPKNAGVKAGTLQAWRPDVNLLQDIDVVQNTANASRVNQQGLIEFVPANTARWDWSDGGSCPKLLVEPQRTNLKPRSLDWTNSIFVLNNTTQSQSAVVAPFNETALKVRETATNSTHAIQIQPDATLTIGQTYARSYFVKPTANRQVVNFGDSGQTGNDGRINVITNTVIDTGANVSSLTSIPFGNIYIVTVIFEATGTIGRPSITIFEDDTTSSYLGDVNEGIDIYHIQYELGAYRTSPIITTAATATRNADVISKSGIASLIGQSEGTLYVEAEWFDSSVYSSLSLSDNTASNRVTFGRSDGGGYTYAVTRAGVNSVVKISIGTLPANTQIKIDVVYAPNNFKLYANGTLIASSTSAITFDPATLTTLQLTAGGGSAPFYGKISALAWWKTALTDAELIDLTTP